MKKLFDVAAFSFVTGVIVGLPLFYIIVTVKDMLTALM